VVAPETVVDKGVAARPHLNEETKSVEYDCVRLPDEVSKTSSTLKMAHIPEVAQNV